MSTTRAQIHTKFYLCRDNVCRRAPSPSGVHRPLGVGRGVKNSKKLGVVSFVLQTATISVFLSVAKCGSMCRAQTYTHSGVEPSTSAKAFLQGGPKSSKKIRPCISETIKIEAYKQRTEKKVYFCPIQLLHVYGPIAHGVLYRVSQKVSDIIPVLRLTPIATQPSVVSVFLSVAKCGRVCRAQTCAHSGVQPSTLAKGFQQGGPKVRKNFEFLTISSLYVPYISATAKNRGL